VPFSSNGLKNMLDAINGGSPSVLVAYASLHTAYSITGANELTGGSPAYARVTLSGDWSAATTAIPSVKALGTAPSAFNVSSSTTVSYIGFFSASTSGTFAGMGPAGAGTIYAFTCPTASPGVFTAPSSAYSNGNTVVLFPGAGATLPTGFTAGTIYYVVSASGATFELAATSGGSAINATGAGAGLVQSIAPETFGSQGTYTLTTSTQLLLY
jgi:hypothetical protein